MQPSFCPPRTSLSGLQLANPDIAEANRVAVILERKRQFFRLRRIRRTRSVRRWARQFDVILHQHAVVEHGHSSGTKRLADLREARAVKKDVVALPLGGG